MVCANYKTIGLLPSKIKFDNDPSAGSPTETLLRLLPGSSQCDQNSFRTIRNLTASNRQSLFFSNWLSPGQRRAVCTKGRDVINAGWWPALTGNSSFKGNNCNSLSQSRRILTWLPGHFWLGNAHSDSFSVARVQPRTSEGITDLLLLNFMRLDAAYPSKKRYRQNYLFAI